MVGIGETYLVAFALAVGIGEVAAGLLSTVPMVAGGLLQLVSPLAVRRLNSRRRWVMTCAATQALSFLPLIAIACVGRAPAVVIFLIAAVYWGAGLGAGPAWNAWVGRLVPNAIRTRYFARRSLAAQLGTLAGLLAGGGILDIAAYRHHPLTGFGIIFLIAAACRFVSARLLAIQSEEYPPDDERMLVPGEILRRFRHGEDGRLLVLLVTVTTAVMIAGPFFTPYMLRRLELPYVAFMGIVGAAFVAKILALPVLGDLAKRVGPLRLLRIGTIGIIPMSVLWLLSTDVVYLVCLQLVSGAAWAAYELAALLLFFDTIREEERTSLLTTFNLINTVAVLAGSLLGALIFDLADGGRAGYHAVFAASFAARLAALPLLLRVGAARVPTLRMLLRVIAARPSTGGLLRPILPSIQRHDPGRDTRDTRPKP